MKDTYLDAKLVKPNQIRLVVFSALPWERLDPVLLVDGKKYTGLTTAKIQTLSQLAIVDFLLPSPLELGHSYFLVLPQYGSIPVDVSEATEFSDFDTRFYYAGDDLGCTYAKEGTRFALWAPLASKASLLYRKQEGDPWQLRVMERSEKGVYRTYLEGDCDGYQYIYSVVNSEIERQATDPYAKGSGPNGAYSVVINPEKTQIDFYRENLPVIDSPSACVIYEGHVRDLTVSGYTDIVHKGKFLGLSEPGRKTKDGLPAGLDYIASLGVTHLQLLPIYDYQTVDELKPNEAYNWGYDPAQYFVPDGSYASDIQDPYSRIKDCQAMVAALHKKGVRVVMDVVYNHVYESQFSVFERVVPNYYFRKRHSGKLAATSGCGNDLCSERPMVRKLILDCCAYWQAQYGIDGFRFDLMGILDVETMRMVEEQARRKDPAFIVYGEGWNMGGEVNVPLAHMGNYALLPRIGFFNDFYREKMKSYFKGDPEGMQPFKNAYAGSCLDFIVSRHFLTANQSINYVECHDNGTFFDYLSKARPDLDEEAILRLVNAANATILLSFGVPFIHSGQEIGASKWGEDNTYNKGDYYNKFSYSLLGKRKWMYDCFKRFVSYRRNSRYLHIYDPRVIDTAVDLSDIGECLHVNFLDKNLIAPLKAVDFFINPSMKDEHYALSLPAKVEYGPNGDPGPNRVSDLSSPKRSLIVTIAK